MVSSSGLTPKHHWRVIPEIAFCEEKTRLQRAFLDAIREVSALQEQQLRSVIDGDEEFTRFDTLLHIAQDKKDRAKYEWISHVEEHGCK